MYVLIDRERMSLLHKHSDINVLANIAWIECQNTSYGIFPSDEIDGFRIYSDIELTLLFRNITGTPDHIFTRPQLLQVLFDLCSRIPVSDIDPLEVEVQSELIKEGDERRWLYVKGAKKPAQLPDLFELDCKHAPRDDKEELAALAGQLPALKRTAPSIKPRLEHDRPVAAVQRPVKAAASPKRGTAKSVIWQVADRMWEEDDRPTNKEAVLELRKRIMDKLEKDEQIKRGSASSELGQWHKARAPY